MLTKNFEKHIFVNVQYLSACLSVYLSTVYLYTRVYLCVRVCVCQQLTLHISGLLLASTTLYVITDF